MNFKHNLGEKCSGQQPNWRTFLFNANIPNHSVILNTHRLLRCCNNINYALVKSSKIRLRKAYQLILSDFC